jgi:hypothetical protein
MKTSFSFRKFYFAVKASVWLIGLNNDHRTFTSILELGKRIEKLIKLSGFTFTVSYLKECYRLITKHLSGEQVSRIDNPRVAVRRGLPLIIPFYLRNQIEDGNTRILKGVLSVLSLFRTMPSYPKLKLETITGPFDGLIKTLPEVNLVTEKLKSKFGKLPKYFDIKSPKGIFTPGRDLALLTSAGPNASSQVSGYPLDALAFRDNPIMLARYKSFAKKTNHVDLFEKLRDEIKALSNEKTLETVSKLIKPGPLKLGKLALKYEAAGKVRVFAIVDGWTQSLLKPLHKNLFHILRWFDSDGTFNQLAPIYRLLAEGKKEFYSFDLTAATDRLPIQLQSDIISSLFQDEEMGLLWKDILTDRDFHLNAKDFPELSGIYRYEVGQPMGALSSWAMLALTHHFIIQIASIRIGRKDWFKDYAVLGDDVVIADKLVADSYLVLMNQLGVSINLSKSVISENGSLEFAKQFFFKGENLSPFGPKALFELLSQPLKMKEFFMNYFPTEEVDTTVLLASIQDLFKRSESVATAKWVQRIQSTYWDLVSMFGLNLVNDLSPSLTALGVDSLLQGTEDLEYKKSIDSLLLSQVTRGWFRGIESDLMNYSKYQRYYLKLGIQSLPSTDALLTVLSVALGKSASHYLYDFEELPFSERLRLAYSEHGKLCFPLEEQGKQKRRNPSRRSKSLLFAKQILELLAQDRPNLMITLVKQSQAVPVRKTGGP